jgi:sterol desaturase/sphingolipid hydroxylase (fatty acid hydroxylase superfamily)
MITQAIEWIRDWLSPVWATDWFVIYCIALAALAAFEMFMPAFQYAPQRHQRWPTNIGIGLLNIGLVTLAPVTAVAGAQWAETKGFGLLNVLAPPGWVAVIATFAISSFVSYVFHVSMHKVRLFWRMHRVHHSDTHLDISTSLRNHPLEVVAVLSTSLLSAIFFGLNPLALAAFELIEWFTNAVSHANLRLPERIDRPLRWLFVTPNMHCLHHSSYQPETDSNYGQVFSIWDRLFGTYSAVPRAGYEGMQIGLKEIRDERASDIVWQMRSPLLRKIEPLGEVGAESHPKS